MRALNAFHDVIQTRRREELTQQFQREMYARAAIEGPISELIRAHYRGTKKVRLQMLITVTATNLKRLAHATADCCTVFVVDGECFAISPTLAA